MSSILRRIPFLFAILVQIAMANFCGGLSKRLVQAKSTTTRLRHVVAFASIPSTSAYHQTKLYQNKLDTTTTTSGAAYHASVNQQIVQRRNEISRKKKAARQKALDSDRQRNLNLRSLFLEENQQQNDGRAANNEQNNAYAVPPMFAIKVVTCPTLRAELKMNGREKRGRMFVERPATFLPSDDSTNAKEENIEVVERPTTFLPSDDSANAKKENIEEEYACMSLKELKQTIHEFFRRLKKSTYILSASLPTLDEEGNVLTHADDMIETNDTTTDVDMIGTRSLESDDDVHQAFIQAEEFFLQHREQNETSALKRPTLVVHVTKDPNALPPPPPPPYLVNMPDPHHSPTMTMLSFYAFPNEGITDPESTAEQLKRLWRPFRALGRIYVAQEGVNAQMGKILLICSV